MTPTEPEETEEAAGEEADALEVDEETEEAAGEETDPN